MRTGFFYDPQIGESKIGQVVFLGELILFRQEFTRIGSRLNKIAHLYNIS